MPLFRAKIMIPAIEQITGFPISTETRSRINNASDAEFNDPMFGRRILNLEIGIVAARGGEQAMAGAVTNGVQADSQVGADAAASMTEGQDLRDLITITEGVGLGGNEPMPQLGDIGEVVTGAVAAVGLVPLAFQVLKVLMGSAVRITARHWSALPGWARTALVGVGLGVGAEAILTGDIPLITLPGQGDGGDGLPALIGPVLGADLDVPGVHLGAHVVGSWIANGVTFYRLSDGKLAVQNKKGRWKVWRPKKPIVLMPSGANDLRTLLRADAVLNRQSKRIAQMLNRRAGARTRKAPKVVEKTVVVATDGHVVH